MEASAKPREEPAAAAATQSRSRKPSSLVRYVARTAAQPIVSLRKARIISRESGGNLLLFALKVAALEVVRRQSLARCPQIWKGIQSLWLLQAPPFVWLQQCPWLRFLFVGSQVFSKPIMVLSIATAITNTLKESRADEASAPVDNQGGTDDTWASKETAPIGTTGQDGADDNLASKETAPIGTLALWSGNMERDLSNVKDYPSENENLSLVKKELQKEGISLSERIDDDELRRFFAAANGNVKRCAAVVKKTARWRESFYFLSPYELEKWSPLVFWHGYDVHMRPSLVIRIGVAYSILKAHERPQFAQAILSQVEYGVTNLTHEDDPRITVIIDCEGTPALGFPINMLKSCCARVQENYPTRLATLFVVNLPPVVHVIAQAIIQVLKPATKKKIHVEGSQCALVEHYGHADLTPKFLGGHCTCAKCENANSVSQGTCLQLLPSSRDLLDDDTDEDSGIDEPCIEGDRGGYHRYNAILRAIIIGFLMLWVIVSLLAGFYDPEDEFLPT